MNLKLLSYASISVLWIAAVIDPVGNFFGLRYLAIALSFFTILILSITSKIASLDIRNVYILLISLLMPLYGTVMCFLRGGATGFSDTSYIAAGLLLVTSLLYWNKDICDYGIKAMIISLRILSTLILYIALYDFFGFDNQWFGILTKFNIALISFRDYYYIKLPYIYFLVNIIYLIF